MKVFDIAGNIYHASEGLEDLKLTNGVVSEISRRSPQRFRQAGIEAGPFFLVLHEDPLLQWTACLRLTIF